MKLRAIVFSGVFLLVFAAVAQAKSKRAIALPEKAVEVSEPATPNEESTIVPQSLDSSADREQVSSEDLNAQLTAELESAAKVTADAVATNPTVAAPLAQASVSTPVSKPTPVAADSSIGGLKESEIPVLAKKRVKATAETNPYSRLLFSLLILGVAAAGLVVFSRWYSKKTTVSTNSNRIRVLNQHFLGPKKSLAIVRVAGETVLVGITEQNISLLKSLSLLDEEIPDSTPSQFSKAMKDADQAAADSDAGPDDVLIGNIRDKISTKLKGMRNI
jgi:flagellar protein FliO/FliZ